MGVTSVTSQPVIRGHLLGDGQEGPGAAQDERSLPAPGQEADVGGQALRDSLAAFLQPVVVFPAHE